MYGLGWGRVECRGRDRVGLNIGLGFSFNEVQIAVTEEKDANYCEEVCLFPFFQIGSLL